jgi:hypothetical protein
MNQPDVTPVPSPAGEPPAGPAGRSLPSLRLPGGLTGRLRTAGIAIPFLILFIVLSVASGSFFQASNLLDVLDQQASTLIIAGIAVGLLVGLVNGISATILRINAGHVVCGQRPGQPGREHLHLGDGRRGGGARDAADPHSRRAGTCSRPAATPKRPGWPGSVAGIVVGGTSILGGEGGTLLAPHLVDNRQRSRSGPP